MALDGLRALACIMIGIGAILWVQSNGKGTAPLVPDR